MKEEDVRIGMKVTVQGVEGVCIVVYEKDYRNENGNLYTLQNETAYRLTSALGFLQEGKANDNRNRRKQSNCI